MTTNFTSLYADYKYQKINIKMKGGKNE